MNIAILTQPLVSNYGGILQAYALQNVLQQYGHEVVFLNRLKGYPSFEELLFRMGSFLKCIVRKYLLGKHNYVLCNPFRKGEYYVERKVTSDNRRLKEFILKNIVLSEPLYSTRDIKKYIAKKHFHCYIVGSDQVWREDYSPCITNYFFDFLGNKKDRNIRRLAYAASLGVSICPISKKNLKKCIKFLGLFDGVSVREQSGAVYLKNVFHYDTVKIVLDPTLLLPVAAYYNLIKKEDCRKSGVVSYILDINSQKDFIISDIANKLNKPNTRLTIHPIDADGNPISSVSISSWLSSFAYSDFVVTDSFHGCVFSILFRKRFIAIGNKDRGIDRFHTLLDKLGLSDRLILSEREYRQANNSFLKEIDYERVNFLCEQLIAESLDFLRIINCNGTGFDNCSRV